MDRPPISAAAMRLLRASARTRRELIDRLVRAGHPPDEAEREAERLYGLGLIDEQAIALAEVRRGVRQGRSRAEIRRKLSARGVEDSAIQRALADEEVGDDLARAVEAAHALAKKGPRAPAPGRLRRIVSGLVRRGYDEETALRAAREALGPGGAIDPEE